MKNLTRSITWIGIILVAMLLACMMIGFAGCRTVELTKTRTETDSTTTQVKTVDSSTYNLIEAMIKYGKSTEKTYTPGRDTVIVNAQSGEVQIIQLPGQLITERIIETGEQQTRTEEAKTYSATDSLIIELLKTQNTRDKETKGVPLPIFFIVAVIFIILIIGLALYIFKKKYQ
jgi:cobalamin biosynthesis Mg chelatase CobN